MTTLHSWKAQYGLNTLGGNPLRLIRDGLANRVNRYGIIEPRGEDTPRNAHFVHDPLTGKLVPSLLHEPAGENLINTEDLRRFIGWQESGGVSVDLTQGQTIPSQGGVPGSPEGEATRIQTTGGSSVIKYVHAFNVGASAGDRSAARVLVHNQGSAPVLFTLNESSGGPTSTPTPTSVGPGGTALFRVAHVADGVGNVRLEIRTNSAGDDLDIVAWGPMVQEGIVASTFPGISGTTRPTDQLARVRDWSLAGIQDGATIWFDLVNEGVFADTGATRRIYMNNDGSAVSPENGLRAFLTDANVLTWASRTADSDVASVTVAAATLATWAIGDRIRFAFRLIADSGQHRLRVDYRRITAAGVVGDVVTGTASSLFTLPTTLSGTLESLLSRGDGVNGAHAALLAEGIKQHTDGVPTFSALEEELS